MEYRSKKELIEWATTLYNEGKCTVEWYDDFMNKLNRKYD